MRNYFTIIILLIIIHFTAYSQQNINYYHKKINKFVKNTYKIDGFELKEIQTNHKLNGKFYIVFNNIDSTSIVYIGRVFSCRVGGCSINNTSINSNYEYFDYIVAFDENGKIQNIKVYNYQATHGQEITAKSWLKQFAKADNQQVYRVNKNIDAISGATISVYAITDDVNIVKEQLREYLSIFDK